MSMCSNILPIAEDMDSPTRHGVGPSSLTTSSSTYIRRTPLSCLPEDTCPVTWMLPWCSSSSPCSDLRFSSETQNLSCASNALVERERERVEGNAWLLKQYFEFFFTVVVSIESPRIVSAVKSQRKRSTLCLSLDFVAIWKRSLGSHQKVSWFWSWAVEHTHIYIYIGNSGRRKFGSLLF